ncbi:MAG: hypothetical protein PHX15_03155 [Candidatus Nanoarchaeia archaeon]|jgi:hypothetical protein|nr:hypothetical protein [Candidatus Nanoarchaeia archaeon]MDD4563841.1 hypothetical protein [Candidatus Nanoarchaeia archaeon]
MKSNKRGDLEIDYLIKGILLFLFIAIMAFAIYILLSGKGTEMINSIKNIFRFGF